MDILVQAIVAAAIELGEYLATLPEKDRQAAVAQLRAQQQTAAADVDALRAELASLKAEHAALLAAKPA